MKKILSISMAYMAALSMGAATLTVGESYVKVSSGAFHPVISADGSKVLYCAEDYQGLNILNLKSSEAVQISEAAGAGFAPIFSNDGQSVIYKEEGSIGKLRANSVMAYSIADEENSQIAPMGRQNYDLTKYASERNVSAKSDYRNIVVNVNGVEKRIDPVADSYSYMGVKVSPDGKRISFIESHNGIFVCDIDGTNLIHVGKGSYQSWLGNEYILSTQCTDDGEHVTSSYIVATEIATGKVTEITPKDSMTEEASGSVEAGKIVCNDVNGRLIVTEISITE